jgi:uncharacterized protein (DUF433 family)
MTTKTLSHGDIRVTSPIATRSMTASLASITPARLSGWSRATAKGLPPLVHTSRGHTRFTVPLVGIAEAMSVAALADAGIGLPGIRQAAQYIRDEMGYEYAAASPALFTDGVDLFVRDHLGYYRSRDKQGALKEALEVRLRPLVIGDDGLVEAVRIEQFDPVEVTIDPHFNAGAMSFTRSRTPVFAVISAIDEGLSDAAIEDEFGVPAQGAGAARRLRDWLVRVT